MATMLSLPIVKPDSEVKMDRIRVMIVDDSVHYRWALLAALTEDSAIEVVEEASDGYEAVEKARALHPDVVLMDLQMPNCGGLEAMRLLHAEMPELRVLVDTVSDQEADLVSTLRAGARGYLLKGGDAAHIIQAVKYVARGGIIVSPVMAAKLRKEPDAEQHGAEAQAPGERQFVATGPIPVPDLKVSATELVISPPLEPRVVLNLHQWLTETANAEIAAVIPTLSGDTVLAVTFVEPVSLLPMLAELPFVDEVTVEPYAETEGSAPKGRWFEDTGQPANRIRVRLKNE